MYGSISCDNALHCLAVWIVILPHKILDQVIWPYMIHYDMNRCFMEWHVMILHILYCMTFYSYTTILHDLGSYDAMWYYAALLSLCTVLNHIIGRYKMLYYRKKSHTYTYTHTCKYVYIRLYILCIHTHIYIYNTYM